MAIWDCDTPIEEENVAIQDGDTQVGPASPPPLSPRVRDAFRFHLGQMCRSLVAKFCDVQFWASTDKTWRAQGLCVRTSMDTIRRWYYAEQAASAGFQGDDDPRLRGFIKLRR